MVSILFLPWHLKLYLRASFLSDFILELSSFHIFPRNLLRSLKIPQSPLLLSACLVTLLLCLRIHSPSSFQISCHPLLRIPLNLIFSEFSHTLITQNSLRNLCHFLVSEFPYYPLLRVPFQSLSSDSHSFSQILSESPSFIMSSQIHFLINSFSISFSQKFYTPSPMQISTTHLLSEILLTSSEYSIRNLLFPEFTLTLFFFL